MAVTISDYLLAYSETHTYSLLVDLFRALDLSKFFEDTIHFILFYTFTFVLNMNQEQLILIIIGSFDMNLLPRTKL